MLRILQIIEHVSILIFCLISIMAAGTYIYSARAFGTMNKAYRDMITAFDATQKSFMSAFQLTALTHDRLHDLAAYVAPQEVECQHCGQRTTGVQRKTLRPDWTIGSDHSAVTLPAVEGHQLILGQMGIAAACSCGWLSNSEDESAGMYQFARHITEVTS